MAKLSYKDIQKLEYDKKQMQFSIDGSLIINSKVIDECTPIHILINKDNYYLCPFCLENHNNFSVESHGLVKCSKCNNQMKPKTLIFVTHCTNEEFAKWVFEYRLSGFFKKINFVQWNKKLKELGIAKEFWDEYKKFKGDISEYDKPEEFNEQQLSIVINGIIDKLNSGYTRETIIDELEENNIEFKLSSFNYCYREAKIKMIKKEMLQ